MTSDRRLTVIAVVLALASCLPVLVARYPQMSDYPAHLARYYVMLDGGRSPDLARWYVFQWKWSGNLGVDLLIRPFAALFGVEAGARLIAGLIPPLTGLGLIAVERQLRGRTTPAALFAQTFVWSPMMLIGLMNYTLGLALALWVFALWVRLDGVRWRWAVMLPLGLVVWLCHLSAWGVLGLMVLGWEWRRPGWRALFAPWPLALPVLVMAALAVVDPAPGGGNGYGAFWWIYKRAIWLKAMRDSVYELDFLSLVGVLGLLGFAAWRRRIDGRLGRAALALLVLSLLAPRHISGGDYVDYRMIGAGLMLAALGVKWPAGALAAWAAPALYLVRLAVTTLSWQADSAETGRLLTALDHVPRGARVASAVLVPFERWQLDHFEHIGAWAVLRRDALVNANFAVAQIHMLHLRHDGYVDPSQRLLLYTRQPVDLAGFKPAQDAEWLWYVGERMPATLPRGEVVWRDPHGLLLRLDHEAAPAKAPIAKSDKRD
ncbi:MAG: hypothetical protein JSS36_06515 [Proteobacteria bacterium]|nr:hypothetical protein [Pseudomonadota bacterium]